MLPHGFERQQQRQTDQRRQDDLRASGREPADHAHEDGEHREQRRPFDGTEREQITGEQQCRHRRDDLHYIGHRVTADKVQKPVPDDTIPSSAA